MLRLLSICFGLIPGLIRTCPFLLKTFFQLPFHYLVPFLWHVESFGSRFRVFVRLLFVCLLVFLSRCMEPEGLWQRLVAAHKGRRPFFLPLYPFPTPAEHNWRHSGSITTSPSPQIRRKALPKQRKKKQRKGRKNRASVWSPPSLLLRPLGSEIGRAHV